MQSFETNATTCNRNAATDNRSATSGGKGQAQAVVREVALTFPDAPNRNVLDGINLSIGQGESVLLLGPSGSGKSTLGYLLGGLIPRSIEAAVTGQVSVNGRVGMLFQDPEAQFCMLTAEDEIAFGLENLRVPRGEMPARIDSALSRFGLLDWKAQNTVRMSGGMKQKLGMACLLAMEPDLYIFDEPTANLDPVATRDVLQAIGKLQQEEGKTVVVIEHKVEGVLDWIDRVVLLGRDGKLLDDGAPTEVFRRRQAEIQEFGIWQPALWKWAVQLSAGTDGSATGKADRDHAAALDLPVTADQLVEQVSRERTPDLLSIIERETGAAECTMSSHPLFKVENASFCYGQEKQIWGPVSFDIQAGEWVAIVGPNGAGKSTLLSALMGLRSLAAGQIEFDGQPLASFSGKELAKNLGFVFQNPEHQFVTDTVWQEVAFAAEGGDVTEQVRSILEDLGLLHIAQANPFSLSQGEKRRLSVAATLLTPHLALLLDEPTFGQDAYTARELEDKLAARHRDGCTIVMVTHDMELVARRAQKVIVLTEGEVAYAGRPYELFQNKQLLNRANLEQPVAFAVADALRRKAGDRHAAFATN